MNVEQITNCIGRGSFVEAEAVWMQAIEGRVCPADVTQVLLAFIKADKAETAGTLGWALLEQAGNLEPAETLVLAKAALLAVPGSEELRQQMAALCKQVHGEHDDFETIYASAGLETGQSPKRAIRTLETCLAITPGAYLANRFDGRVICVQRLTSLGEYEFTDEGQSETLEPKLLADEFDLLAPTDIRLREKTDPDGLAKAFQKDLASVLIGVCQARGGQIDSVALKEFVVPKFIAKDKWSGWWSRARNAVKKCEFLTLEGRSPVTLSYHPQGRSVEEDFAEPLAKAYHPLEYLDVLRTYLREVGARKVEPSAEFQAQVVQGIVDRMKQCVPNLLGEAFECALALQTAGALGVAVPEGTASSAEILAKANNPAASIAKLTDTTLWPAAIEALHARTDATEQFKELLYLAPTEQLDTVAQNAVDLGDTSAVTHAVTEAFNDALRHIDLCLWVWSGPSVEIVDMPNHTTVLLKLLDMLFGIDHHWTGDAEGRRVARQKLRSAISARNYQSFKKVIEEIDEHMGAVIKTKIERTDGLAQTVSDKLLHLLRQKHHKLFLEKKLQRWEDDRFIWTTEEAIQARQEALREIRDVKIPANAKQIGEAADEGDLSENADWEAAIAERDMLMARANKIQGELAIARIIVAEDVPAEHVGIGSRVRLRRADTGQDITVGFLGPWDSKPTERIYSYTTRLGKTLMGKRLGVTLELEIDNEAVEYTIEELGSAAKSSLLPQGRGR